MSHLTCSVHDLIGMVRARRISVCVEAGEVKLKGPVSTLPPDLLAACKRRKLEIKAVITGEPVDLPGGNVACPKGGIRLTWARQASALLASIADDERRAGLRELFEERCAIAEVDGGLSRVEAERLAYEELLGRVVEGVNL